MFINQEHLQLAMYFRKELSLLNKLAHLKHRLMDLAISYQTVSFCSSWSAQAKKSRICFALLIMRIIFRKINIASCLTWPS